MSLTTKDRIRYLTDKCSTMALLIDFDGTMVDLVPDPDAVYVPTSLISDIESIVNNENCAFAIVTGRTIARLDQFLGGLKVPIVGSHGGEIRLKHNNSPQPLITPMPLSDRTAMEAVSKKHNCIFEDKTYSLSLHLPIEFQEKNLIVEIAAALNSRNTAYHIRKAGRTYEVLQKGVNKGSGIQHLMQQQGFFGRTPVYIGDDAFIDESLVVVDNMGGSRIPVAHYSPFAPQTETALLDTTFVRKILSDVSQLLTT
jgi:trehalose 6-phosphate phosphatase